MRSEQTGRSKGYGFVEFMKIEDVERAQKEFALTISGRQLSCQLANFGVFEYEHVHSITLRVHKFASSTKPEDLEKLFRSQANVQFCQVTF